MVYKFFDKKSPSLAWSEPLALQDKSTSGSGIKNENISNNELAEELHKRIKRNFFLFFFKVHSSFIDNTWGVDLADMQFISKFNKGICFFIICYE